MLDPSGPESNGNKRVAHTQDSFFFIIIVGGNLISRQGIKVLIQHQSFFLQTEFIGNFLFK